MTQISTRPRATQQGRVKYRRHITVPGGPNTVSNSGGRRIKKIIKSKSKCKVINQYFFKSNPIGWKEGWGWKEGVRVE